ncbi:hypothetical protein SASPL_151983 [Salvia splendens]|uniref:Uncharacterized protein n=1 Tax=Salvia splendens TaxID=180675 RepID=A0A8X8Z0V9_SALSN|nr:uncharacterized protein LOC121783332 [Salvia splendens]KAG6386807.1 hypothetical protein SASPL_151983 [Salvia splendens]
MGNCQAAEAAAVVIQNHGGKVDRIYSSVSATEVMNANPGHYVALVVAAENAAPIKQLKLLRPDDALVIGQVYKLISFEDVLKEFAANKSVKLGKLLKERGALERKRNSNQRSASVKMEASGGGSCSRSGAGRPNTGRPGQWRPALQSISEQVNETSNFSC